MRAFAFFQPSISADLPLHVLLYDDISDPSSRITTPNVDSRLSRPLYYAFCPVDCCVREMFDSCVMFDEHCELIDDEQRLERF